MAGQNTRESVVMDGALEMVAGVFPEVAEAMRWELASQRGSLKMIASENYCSPAVMAAMGNWLTDKYAEGVPYSRFYAGCEHVDQIEQLAVDEVRNLFGADFAYVQPHSGADANLIALWSMITHRVQDPELERLGLKNVMGMSGEDYEAIRQKMCQTKLLGLSLGSGGHLTHGFRQNVSSKFCQAFSYDVDPKSLMLDYKEIERVAKEVKPDILLAGYSAYSRTIDFAKMREIADSVGATLWGDIAHFAGLVAGKQLTGNFDPVPFCDIITSTTHKTLRGPRGGLILCKKEYEEAVKKGCPMVIGGPLENMIAAKAVAFREASQPAFVEYAKQVIANSRAFAERMMSRGGVVLSGGTDNHMAIIDVKSSFGLTGRQAEIALREASITCNRNSIPFDAEGAWYTSGIRLGSPALTSRGMKEGEMEMIADFIFDLLKGTKARENSRAKADTDPNMLREVGENVASLLGKFPLYPEFEF